VREERANKIGMVSEQLRKPTKATTVYLTHEVRRALDLKAAQRRMTLSALVSDLLSIALEKEDRHA
jgi:hypothetical protein